MGNEKTTQEKCELAAQNWVVREIIAADLKELHKRRNRGIKSLKSIRAKLETLTQQVDKTLEYLESDWED